MSSSSSASASSAAGAASTETVEAVVREKLGQALGGRRGVLEAAIPTVAFTLLWLTTRDLRIALAASLAFAVVALVIRLVQRSSVQFVVNALFGIGIGALFVTLSARSGGDANDQALAYFLPGVLYNLVYAVGLGASCVAGWPVMGFMVGSVTGDPTGWHEDKAVVRLCSRLTWVLVVPCLIRVLIQGPVWLAARFDWVATDPAVATLGLTKIGLGWPLQLAAFAVMAWLLGRNATPRENHGSTARA